MLETIEHNDLTIKIDTGPNGFFAHVYQNNKIVDSLTHVNHAELKAKVDRYFNAEKMKAKVTDLNKANKDLKEKVESLEKAIAEQGKVAEAKEKLEAEVSALKQANKDLEAKVKTLEAEAEKAAKATK